MGKIPVYSVVAFSGTGKTTPVSYTHLDVYKRQDINELKAKRDKQLFEVFRLAKKFMDDPV